MKKIKHWLVPIILNLTTNLFAQNVVIDGHTFLENQTNHENIQIIFKRVAPTILYDTTFTDINGYYSHSILQGIYNIYFTKSGYLSDSLTSQNSYTNITLPNITLFVIGLSGQLSGTINSGIYKVGGNIEVANSDTLLIMPGVKLMFTYNTEFTINGLLKAVGTKSDSIYFTSYNDTTWKGITINNIANDNTLISYAIIENSNDKGIELYYSNPTLTNLTLRNNNAYASNSLDSSFGGGIYIYYSHPILNEILFNNNYAFYGSAIHAKGSTFKIGDCIFRNNISYYTTAIHLTDNSSTEIINTKIINSTKTNWTAVGPTAVGCYNSKVILENSIIANNQYGGIILTANSYLKSINSLFYKNNGSNNGYTYGIVTDNSQINIINSIISGHKSNGIFNDATSQISVYRSCFWDNNVNLHTDVNFIGHIVTINMNGDSCDAYLNIFKNSLFEDSIELKLSINSPCIDAGLNDSIYFLTDILNNVRIFDGDNDGLSIVDMGPYEYGAPIINSYISYSDNLLKNKIYPNPCNSVIFVKIEKDDLSIQLYNSLGQKIYMKRNLINSIESTEKIDLSMFSNGLYIIQIQNINGMTTNIIYKD